jgi:small-conductance mechanosensitive channel
MDWMNDEMFVKVIESLAIVVGGVILVGVLNRGLRLMAQNANLPRLALNPIRVLLRYFVLAAVLCLVLTRFGYEVSGLLTMLTGVLAMVAIGFVAVWSILSNFLCTFVLILFKPFSVGDQIEIPADEVAGRVVDLSLLYTTIRREDGATYQIPNNLFFQRIFLRRRGDKVVELGDQLQREKPAE